MIRRHRISTWQQTALLTLAVLLGAPSRASAPVGRYTITSDTVYDTITKVTWQRFPSLTQYSWADAQTFCGALSLGGAQWRVPTVKELLSLIDYQGTATMFDPVAFPNTPPDAYWSITRAVGNHVWLVQFADGTVTNASPTGAAHVRCVR